MKKIVIMGASSGIGLAVAEALASRGVRVGIAARRIEKLRELKSRYPDFVEYETIDIDKEDAESRLLHLIGRLGGMDIYFHVAGIGYENPGLHPAMETRIVQTNAVAFARMLSTAYRYLRGRGKGGQIAAITSVAGTKGIGAMTAYSASKSFDQAYMVALDQLSRTENAGISITDIRPGWTSTPLLHENTQYPLEMDLDYVLPQVLRAIVRRRRVAVIDWRWNIVTSLWRLIPDFLWVRMPLTKYFTGVKKTE